MFTSMRVLPETLDDDHLILGLRLNFLSAEELSVVLAMQLHRSVGLGMMANMHLTRMHVEKARYLVSFTILSLTMWIGNLVVLYSTWRNCTLNNHTYIRILGFCNKSGGTD